MKNYSVHELRKNGYKIRVIHKRYYSSYGNLYTTGHVELLTRRDADLLISDGIKIFILPKGGFTKVEITTPDGRNLDGQSECSIKDSFNRKLGLKIALNRAMAAFSE